MSVLILFIALVSLYSQIFTGVGIKTFEHARLATRVQLNDSATISEEQHVIWNGNYSFPSREERIKYYMGQWYGQRLQPLEFKCKTLDSVNILDSKFVGNVPVMYSGEKILNELQTNPDWRVSRYLKEAYDILALGIGINSTEAEKNRSSLILIIGDGMTIDVMRNIHFPIISKARPCQHVTDENTGRPFPAFITWPLNMFRHYVEVDKYVRLKLTGKVQKWEDKISRLVWRGVPTGYLQGRRFLTGFENGPRIQAVLSNFHKNITDIDVAFSNKAFEYNSRLINSTNYARDHYGMNQYLGYKYLLSIEGNDVATGLKWQLASNSVVFMAKPVFSSFAMEDFLVPFVHYIPVKNDYSDLMEVVEWARKNDEKCQWISAQANLFMERLWISEEAKRDNAAIQLALGKSYYEQFSAALRSCQRKWVYEWVNKVET